MLEAGIWFAGVIIIAWIVIYALYFIIIGVVLGIGFLYELTKRLFKKY